MATAYFAEHVKLRTMEADDVIIHEGEQGDSMFFVASGMMRVLVEKRNGTNPEIAHIGPGDFFGEMSLVSGEARSATVISPTMGYLG